ncbi:MAG: diaminopropionate ammonia-lyase [Sphaerochaetaceae bacterium]|nr:diaminopropionate ammonia-lyase [Spirochaetales bacterium]MDY5500725.1 diaminopropionate ammonia-lyase [Sphaerochaetaceae bacterium]
MDEQQLDFSWIVRPNAHKDISVAQQLFPVSVARTARAFHRQIPGYNQTRLVALSNLAHMLGLGGIYVKDESQRLMLNSFKVLGGSFALFRLIQKKLGVSDEKMTFEYMTSEEAKAKTGDITFAAATDGNHGRGVAWAASKLGYKCVIYVHSGTSQPRIDAIRQYGAIVRVIPGNYDHAVRQLSMDAKAHGWTVVSDTSWPGYTEIPTWIMQGYTTMFLECQEQLAGLGITRPTHIFIQAGVGALAASIIGFYSALFPDNPPKFVVVEPDRAACLFKSAEMNDGEPHSIDGELNTICAGLACGEPSPLAWRVLRSDADVFMKVPDYIAARGMRIYAVPLKGDEFIISGESGAITLGALYSLLTEDKAHALVETLGLNNQSQVLLVNSEGNTDPINFRQILWDGAKRVPKQFRKQW